MMAAMSLIERDALGAMPRSSPRSLSPEPGKVDTSSPLRQDAIAAVTCRYVAESGDHPRFM